MAKRSIGIVAALLVAASCFAANPAGKSVSYPSGTETVTGYLALPEGGGKKPALVVIQEWWGLNDFIRGFRSRGRSVRLIGGRRRRLRGQRADTGDERQGS